MIRILSWWKVWYNVHVIPNFIREKRCIAQFEQFGKLFSDVKNEVEDQLGNATEVAKDVTGGARDMAVNGATEAAKQTLRVVWDLNKKEVMEQMKRMRGAVGEGLEEFMELSRRVDPRILQPLMAGKDAIQKFMSDSANLAKLKGVLEQLVDEGSIKLSHQVLELIMEHDPSLRESISLAELAERALVGDMVAHQKLVNEDLQKKWLVTRWGYSLSSPWSRKGQNGRRYAEQKEIEKGYKDELDAIVKAHPYLSERFIRKIIQEGVPSYVPREKR